MKNLRIGQVYNFDYDCEFPTENQGDVCVLTQESQFALVTGIANASDKIKTKFKNLGQDAKKLKKLIDEFEKKKSTLSSTDKWQYNVRIKKMKDKLFPKTNITDPKIRACNLFIRFYNPDRITLNENSKLQAVYAGKKWTPKGNVVHKWYQLSPSKIKESYRVGCEEYLKIIDVKNTIGIYLIRK